MAGVGVINFVWQAHFKEIGYQLNPDCGASPTPTRPETGSRPLDAPG